MDSKWGYRMTQKAGADLDDIVGYLTVELSNPTAASDFVYKLQDSIEKIRLFPESSPLVVNDFMPDTKVRKKSVGNYIVYYLPDDAEKMIFILRIIHSRRNMDEILRELHML